MRRVDGQWRQDREQLGQEDLLQPRALHFGDVGRIQHAEAFGGELHAELLPQPLLHRHEVGGRGVHPLKLFAGGQAVLADHPYALAHLALQAGDADHVELVEIVGRDRQESQPLEQRMVCVVAFLEHAFVERQPREFPIEEARGRLHQRRFQDQGRGRGRGGRTASCGGAA